MKTLFSKKVTTEKIIGSLAGFFDAGYGSLVVGLKDSFKDELGPISEEQDRELIAVPMFAIIRAIMPALGDTTQAQNIIGGFQHEVFNKYFKDTEKRNQFGEMFWRRCDEYSTVLHPENKDLAIQIGQIFYTHFFGKEEDGSHLAMMMVVGGSFLSTMTETKKFLDEILSKYEIV